MNPPTKTEIIWLGSEGSRPLQDSFDYREGRVRVSKDKKGCGTLTAEDVITIFGVECRCDTCGKLEHDIKFINNAPVFFSNFEEFMQMNCTTCKSPLKISRREMSKLVINYVTEK